jgi:hypothetical protein
MAAARLSETRLSSRVSTLSPNSIAVAAYAASPLEAEAAWVTRVAPLGADGAVVLGAAVELPMPLGLRC